MEDIDAKKIVNLSETTLYSQIGWLFETATDEEIEYYRQHFSERALFNSMATQINKLIKEINELNSAIEDIDKISKLKKNSMIGARNSKKTGPIDLLQKMNNQLLSYLQSQDVQQTIREVDNNTGLFGGGRDKNYLLTSKDFSQTRKEYSESLELNEGLLDSLKSTGKQIGQQLKNKSQDFKNNLKSFTSEMQERFQPLGWNRNCI